MSEEFVKGVSVAIVSPIEGSCEPYILMLKIDQDVWQAAKAVDNIMRLFLEHVEEANNQEE